MHATSRKALTLARAAALALAAAGTAAAQNDECAGAITLVPGVGVAFDTTAATLSAPGWPCAASSAPDLWYTYTAAAAGNVTVSTCNNATYDTALEVFSGGCAGLVSVACLDDSCGLQTALTWAATQGTTYHIRVGGYATSVGQGTLTLTIPTPPPANCVESIYANNNGGSLGGAIYFDLTATSAVTLSGLETNYSAVAGTAVGVTLYTIAGTYAGNEANMAAWTLAAVDDGMAVSAGTGVPTAITFAAPLNLAAGTYGIALVATGSAHAYTNGTGVNQNYVSPNGVLAIAAGSALNVPFTGTPFTPRVWNGRFCTSGPGMIGTSYCTAVANSTGNAGDISGLGSAVVATNNLSLRASSLPNNAFGFFLTSATQGFVTNPGGSAGNLCLGGQIGRYVGAGQIKNSGLVGEFTLALDLTQTPTPMGFVSVAAGQTRNFQAWYRDAVGGVATSNFTDGLSVHFQ